MKRTLFLLLAGLLAANVWAGENSEAETESAPEPIAAPAAPKGTAPAPAGTVPGSPADCCPPNLVKVCVPEPSKKKTSTPYYDCVTKDYCLPKCPWPFGCFRKKCAECGDGCPNCSKPRTRNVLVKKIATEECDTFKCVPKTILVPPCPVIEPCPAVPCK